MIIVDSNVLIDILTQDSKWYQWSSKTVSRLVEEHKIVINPIIYAEVSVSFDRIEDLEIILSEKYFQKRSVPYEAAFLAAKCYVKYRRRGGNKLAPLPDFFIGAHAAITGLPLVTRDISRYKTYFPTVKLISP